MYAVDDDVVDEAPRLVEESRIQGLPVRNALQVVGNEVVDFLQGALA